MKIVPSFLVQFDGKLRAAFHLKARWYAVYDLTSSQHTDQFARHPMATATRVPAQDNWSSTRATAFVNWRREADSWGTIQFINITAQDSHTGSSVEELRLEDYKERGIFKCGSGTPVPGAELAVLVPIAPSGPSEYPRALTASQNQLLRRADVKQRLHLGGDILCFNVGQDPVQTFTIHESLLLERSEFVRAAVTGEWKEGQERLIVLPHQEPETFALYQQWLYIGTITSQNGDDRDDEYQLLVKAYVLGEQFLDIEFKDAVVDAIVCKLDKTKMFDPRLTHAVYDNTPARSPLRRLWQDVYMWLGVTSWLDEEVLGGPVHGGFATDLSRRQMEMRGCTSFPAVLQPADCRHHEHQEGKCHHVHKKPLHVVNAESILQADWTPVDKLPLVGRSHVVEWPKPSTGRRSIHPRTPACLDNDRIGTRAPPHSS